MHITPFQRALLLPDPVWVLPSLHTQRSGSGSHVPNAVSSGDLLSDGTGPILQITKRRPRVSYQSERAVGEMRAQVFRTPMLQEACPGLRCAKMPRWPRPSSLDQFTSCSPAEHRVPVSSRLPPYTEPVLVIGDANPQGGPSASDDNGFMKALGWPLSFKGP